MVSNHRIMQTIISIMRRTLFRSGLFALAFPLLAHASLPQSSIVPGGVAVIPLGSVSAGAGTPQTWVGDQPVLVTADHDEWYAVVGLPLDIAPGSHELRIKIGDVTRMQDFMVGTKDYPEQRIILKDKSKVELSPADEARAEREIAAITELKHHWRAAQRYRPGAHPSRQGKTGRAFRRAPFLQRGAALAACRPRCGGRARHAGQGQRAGRGAGGRRLFFQRQDGLYRPRRRADHHVLPPGPDRRETGRNGEQGPAHRVFRDDRARHRPAPALERSAQRGNGRSRIVHPRKTSGSLIC